MNLLIPCSKISRQRFPWPTLRSSRAEVSGASTTTSLATSSNIVNDATLIFRRTDAAEVDVAGCISSPISGAFAVEVGEDTATGTLNLNGTHTYTGPTNVTAGRLALGGSVTLGGTLNVIPGPNLAPGTTFTILSKTSAGAVSGTFAGLANQNPAPISQTATTETIKILIPAGSGRRFVHLEVTKP